MNPINEELIEINKYLEALLEEQPTVSFADLKKSKLDYMGYLNKYYPRYCFEIDSQILSLAKITDMINDNSSLEIYRSQVDSLKVFAWGILEEQRLDPNKGGNIFGIVEEQVNQ
jgi:hypothetical protein